MQRVQKEKVKEPTELLLFPFGNGLFDLHTGLLRPANPDERLFSATSYW